MDHNFFEFATTNVVVNEYPMSTSARLNLSWFSLFPPFCRDNDGGIHVVHEKAKEV